MFRFDKNLKKIHAVNTSDLKKSEIWERKDLQAAIVNSWETFTKEIGSPELMLVGQEVAAHNDVDDRIDILAFDPLDLKPVIIELKRGKNKLHCLQAVSYASMIASWLPEQLKEAALKNNEDDFDDFAQSLESCELPLDPRIILIAEDFDPTVILTADWLSRTHSVDLAAFKIKVFEIEQSTYIDLTQIYPLAELAETYSSRSTRVLQKNENKDEISWSEIASSLKYDWGAEAINICRSVKNGNPARRHFTTMRSNFHGFAWINLNFRKKYLNVYLKGKPDNAVELLSGKFTSEIEINSWSEGYTFNVKTREQCLELFSWLQINTRYAA